MNDFVTMKKNHRHFLLLVKLFYFCFVTCILSFFLSLIMPISLNQRFENYHKSHVKYGIESLDLEVAESELGATIKYLKEKNLNDSKVSVFFSNSKNNLKNYYNSIEKLYLKVKSFPKNASHSQKINMFENLKRMAETITIPYGIAIYPYNNLFLIWSFLSFVGIFVSRALRNIFREKDKDLQFDIFTTYGEIA